MKNDNALSPITTFPTPEEFRVIEMIVKHAVDSKYFDKIGGISGAMAIALFAREMGLPLMACLFGGVRPVLGKVEIAPQMMNAMIRRAGHILKTVEHNDQICRLWAKRKDTGEEMAVSFSIDDAKRANIYKGAWIAYPKNMVYKSALSNLAKWLFPDVIGMSYVEGEIDPDSLESSEPIQKSPISSQTEETHPQTEITHPEPKEATKEMSINEFTMQIGTLVDNGFESHPKLEEFLYELSVKKNGKPIPLQKVMQQAIKLPDRFVKSYKDWYANLAENLSHSDQAIDKI